jgi:3-phosphoshikimate 1-carboxyvinyltransferase
LSVKGTGAFTSGELNFGESGLSTRLMTSICATQKGAFTIKGEGSLLKRPMTFFETILPEMGVKYHSNNGFLPIQLEGPIVAGNYTLDGSMSSQYISGMLMALPLVNGESRITVENLASGPYVEMTLRTLFDFGIEILRQDSQFIIGGNQHYLSNNQTVEGDWSAASYWLIASALGQDISVDGLSLNSLQADRRIIDLLELANCSLEYHEHGIQVIGEDRKAFEFDATDCPDLFPALVTFASLTKGVSRIKGIGRLATKESNRALSLQTEFGKLGIEIRLEDDNMFIHGKSTINGGVVDSHNDHRIAMCLAIAGLYTQTPLQIQGAEAVEKSYPAFWNDLESFKEKSI